MFCVTSSNLPSHNEVSTTTAPMLQMKKLRLRVPGSHVQGHMAGKALSLDGNPDSLTSRPILLAMTFVNYFLIRILSGLYKLIF